VIVDRIHFKTRRCWRNICHLLLENLSVCWSFLWILLIFQFWFEWTKVQDRIWQKLKRLLPLKKGKKKKTKSNKGLSPRRKMIQNLLPHLQSQIMNMNNHRLLQFKQLWQNSRVLRILKLSLSSQKRASLFYLLLTVLNHPIRLTHIWMDKMLCIKLEWLLQLLKLLRHCYHFHKHYLNRRC